jgi:uncharacterized membrane protein
MCVMVAVDATHFWVSFGCAVSVYALAEFAWLSSMLPRVYAPLLGGVSRDGKLAVRSKGALALTYTLLLFGAARFVLRRGAACDRDVWRYAFDGALFGLVVYGVYNTTNMTTLSRYSWRMVAVDSMWGGASMALLAAAFGLIYESRNNKVQKIG